MAWRWILQFDRRLLLAALGLSMAFVLPAVATLVVQGFEPTLDDGRTFVENPTQEQLNASTYVVGYADGKAAILKGDPLVAPGETSQKDVVLVPRSHTLVHPSEFNGKPSVALASNGVPVRAGDAFESQGIASLQDLVFGVVFAGAVGAVLVSVAFATFDADQWTKRAALFTTLGHQRLGATILLARMAILVVGAGIFAVVVVFALWLQGTIRPTDTKPAQLALAFLIPIGAALLSGSSVALRLRNPLKALFAERTIRRIPFRPLLLGTNLVPLLLVSSLLFGAQIALPLSAALVPAEVAGNQSEWVLGASDGVPGKPTPLGPGRLLHLHPDVDESVSEVVLPTSVNGKPVVVRGADPDRFAAYHEVKLEGSGPWIGERALETLGLGRGDEFLVLGRGSGELHLLEANGLMKTKGSLADEILVPLELGQTLGGLSSSQVDVVRVRPSSVAALEAMEGTPGIELENLHITATGDGIARASVDARLADNEKTARSIAVYVNEELAHQEVISMNPWSEKTFNFWVPVPDGPFSIRINPEGTGEGTRTENLQLPSKVVGGENFVLQATRQGTVGVGSSIEEALSSAQYNVGDSISLPSGTHYVALTESGPVEAVHVLDPKKPNESKLVALRAWTEPSQIQPGQLFTWYAEVANYGGNARVETINLTHQGGTISRTEVFIPSGTSSLVFADAYARNGNMRVLGETIQTQFPQQESVFQTIQSGEAAQTQATERALGNGANAIGALAGLSIASTAIVISLGSARVLLQRKQVLDVVQSLGQRPDQVERRISMEASALAAAAAIVAILATKFLFWLLQDGPLYAFGHVPQDPLDWVLSLQVLAGFMAAVVFPIRRVTRNLLEAP